MQTYTYKTNNYENIFYNKPLFVKLSGIKFTTTSENTSQNFISTGKGLTFVEKFSFCNKQILTSENYLCFETQNKIEN